VIGSGGGCGSPGWVQAITLTSNAGIRAADGRDRGRAGIRPVFITTYLLGCQQSAFEQVKREAHAFSTVAVRFGSWTR
jgi:hypothetical protein